MISSCVGPLRPDIVPKMQFQGRGGENLKVVVVHFDLAWFENGFQNGKLWSFLWQFAISNWGLFQNEFWNHRLRSSIVSEWFWNLGHFKIISWISKSPFWIQNGPLFLPNFQNHKLNFKITISNLKCSFNYAQLSSNSHNFIILVLICTLFEDLDS